MNTTVGKSFGLALLLAVGIIAVMVAMGTFSAQKAGADDADADATHTVMATDVVVKPLNPQAGAGVELTINAGGGTAVTPLSEITVTLKNFGVPDDISEDEIVLRETGGSTNNNSANPDNVRVDGDTIVIEVPDMDGDGSDNNLTRPFNILIRKRAGITTPTTAGEHHIKVEIEGAAAVYQHLAIKRTLSVDPKSGGGSTEVTVTGKALANGTATLYSDALILPDVDEDGMVDVGATEEDPDRSRLKSVTVAGGTFETTVDAKDLMKAGSDGRSVITVSDSNGDEATVVFTVTGTTTLGSDSVGKGKSLEISIADWVEVAPDGVKIDGVPLEIQDEDGMALDLVVVDNEATFYVKVIGAVGLGTKTVVLFAGDKRLDSASVEITAIDLTVSPSTATVGQEVTISGSGFTGKVESIMVGDATVCDNTDGDTNTGNDCDIEVASGGRVISGFSIPNKADLADDGDYTITVTDSDGRIGSGTVTIPEPTLTVDPTESRFGSTINLSGAGWPTGTGANLVEILYEGIQYSTAITNSNGAWSDSISVPASAGVGQTHTVKAQATVGDEDDNVAQEADHSTPAAVVTLSSSQAQRGTNVTVSGENFHVFETVMIEIGDSNVTPSPAPTTDGDGSFSTQVLVPGLALGNKNVRVTVKDVPVVEFLEVITTPVVMTVESVFGDLIDNGSLQTIWAYDFATGGWSSYTTDPETSFGNDLFELSSGDILYINVTGEQSFSHQKGNTLPDGWSLITLK